MSRDLILFTPQPTGDIYIYIFIYLLDIHLIPLPWGRYAKMSRKKKNGLGQRMKPSTPIDVHIGKEEKNRRKSKIKKCKEVSMDVSVRVIK